MDDQADGEIRRVAATYLVLLLPLISLLLNSLYLSLKVLGLDVDLSQPEEEEGGINER